MILGKSNYIEILQQNIASAIRQSSTTASSEEKLTALQKELIQKANNRETYDNVADEIFHLRELKEQAKNNGFLRDDSLKRTTESCDFLKKQKKELTKPDELLVRRMIEKITVYDDCVSVEFKSGVKIDIDE